MATEFKMAFKTKNTQKFEFQPISLNFFKMFTDSLSIRKEYDVVSKTLDGAKNQFVLSRTRFVYQKCKTFS